MSSVAVTPSFDTSDAQTINYGNGQSLFYDPSTGLYMDNGGNVLQPSDVAAYGQPVSTSTGIVATPSAPPAPATPSNNSAGATSGLTSLFGSILGATSGVGSALNPPKTVNGVPMVYNAASGGYIPASTAGAAVSNLSLTPLIIVAGLGILAVIVYFALKR